MGKKMKRLVLCTLFFALSIVIYSQPLNNIKASKWLEEKFAKGNIPPFSFIYDGKSSDTFITSWEYKSEKIKSSGNDVEEYIYTYSDKQTGFGCKMLCHLFQ
jgi:alpha-galactosidase